VLESYSTSSSSTESTSDSESSSSKISVSHPGSSSTGLASNSCSSLTSSVRDEGPGSWNISSLRREHFTLVMCTARLQAVGRPKLGRIRPSRARPKSRPDHGLGPGLHCWKAGAGGSSRGFMSQQIQQTLHMSETKVSCPSLCFAPLMLLYLMLLCV